MKVLKGLFIISGLSLFSLIVITDLLSKFYPSLSFTGVFLWYISYIYLFIYAAGCAFFILRRSIKAGGWPILLFFLSLGFLFWKYTFPLSSISAEATQEINCALNQLTGSADRGWRENCLFGYPSRQYFLPALPSLIFGRTLANLQIGGSLYIIIGLVIFTSSLFSILKPGIKSGLLVTLILSSAFHFYFFNHMTFLFEQSIFPAALMFAAIGAFVHYFSSRNNLHLMLLAFIMLYLIFSYTTSLAGFLLILSALLYLFFFDSKSLPTRFLIAGIILFSLYAFLMSFSFRKDIILFPFQPVTSSINITDDLSSAFSHLFFGNLKIPYLSPVFTFIFISITFLGLLFTFGLLPFFLSVWMTAVIILSVISQGYSYYVIAFRLHRSLVILPVFLTLLAYLVIRFKIQISYRILTGLLVLILGSGLYYADSLLSVRDTNKHYPFISWISENNIRIQPGKLYLLNGTNKYNNFDSLNDTLQYFLPQLVSNSVYNITISECRDILSNQGLAVLPPDDSCIDYLKNTSYPNSQYIGDFPVDSGTLLSVFEIR